MSQREIPFENTFEDWRNLKFKFPKKEIRLATLFTGIGAIEQALKRLKLKHHIVFAGDINQIDTPYLDSQSNGLSYLIDKLKGQKLYSHVTLRKGERSDLANLANELL